MKKVIFSLIATVFMGVSSVNAQSIKPSEYGFYHNEAIILYSKAYMDEKTDLSKVSINSIAEGMKTELQKKYPTVFKNVDLAGVQEHYKNYSTVSSYDFVSDWNKNKALYLSKGYVTKLTYGFIDDAIKNDLDYKALSSKIEEISKNNVLSNEEKIAFEVAKSVLSSSYELWKSSNNVSTQKRNHCNGKIIISDVGAALMFAPAPYLSLIAGGISSLITAYSDGHCK